MTGFQSTLADSAEGVDSDALDPEGGVAAEELEGSLRSISIAEFFEKNKHMLGFDSEARSIITAVKEGVDNSLDATEEAGILPDVYVEIKETGDYYTLIIEDNGPGITKSQIPKIFGKLLYGSRFHTRAQARGQQGIGISAAVLYSQLTSGKPARITSRTQDRDTAKYFELLIDTDTNEPEIRKSEEVDWDRPHGTRIEMEMEANMRSRQSLHEYIQSTAVVNPHARITFVEPKMDEPRTFERATDEMPDEVEEIKPHPHGVELGTLQKMLAATDSHSLSGFLTTEFTRVGQKTAETILDNFRDQHYGRELSWTVPDTEEVRNSIHEAVMDAVSGKGAEATDGFAKSLIDSVVGNDITYSTLERLVHETADESEDDFGKRFGSTVRENAVDAVWDIVDSDEFRENTTYQFVDDATTTRKADETVSALADRLAEKLASDTNDRYCLTHDELEESVNRAADLTVEYDGATIGGTARENITDAVWSAMVTVPDDVPKVKEVLESRDTTSNLLEAMQEAKVNRPSDKCLSPIRAEIVEEGMRKEYDADFYAAATRDADVHSGDPFVVEAGIAYGGDIDGGKMELKRFANRVPLVYQAGACAIGKTVKNIRWRNYNLSQSGNHGIPDGPAILVVHVASTNVPFTSESKDALASVPAIEHEIEQAVRSVSRDLKDYLNKQQKLEKKRKKQNVIADILPEFAEKVSSVAESNEPDVDESLAKIMNNVLVRRTANSGDVTVSVSNYTNGSQSLALNDVVSHEVFDLSEGDATEVDGDWVVTWDGTLSRGETIEITYTTDDDAEFSADVTEVPDELVTITNN